MMQLQAVDDITIKLSKPVSKHASILLGELVAILLTLEYILAEINLDSIDGIQIFSDSQSSIGLLTLGWKPKQYHTTIEEIKSHLDLLDGKASQSIYHGGGGGHAH
jgi:hypothetical protein